MSAKPILFSSPMILALLAGRKTQTRRIIKGAPGDDWFCDRVGGAFRWVAEGGTPSLPCRLPYAVGDRAWVREAWRTECNFDHLPPRDLTPDGQQWRYEADGVWSDHDDMTAAPGRLRPGMFMPRWASRAFVTVADARVQRLREISEADAIAEGIVPTWPDGVPLIHDGTGGVCREAYFSLWNRLHGPDADFADPWVAAYSFDVTLRNIDAAKS